MKTLLPPAAPTSQSPRPSRHRVPRTSDPYAADAQAHLDRLKQVAALVRDRAAHARRVCFTMREIVRIDAEIANLARDFGEDAKDLIEAEIEKQDTGLADAVTGTSIESK